MFHLYWNAIHIFKERTLFSQINRTKYILSWPLFISFSHCHIFCTYKTEFNDKWIFHTLMFILSLLMNFLSNDFGRNLRTHTQNFVFLHFIGWLFCCNGRNGDNCDIRMKKMKKCNIFWKGNHRMINSSIIILSKKNDVLVSTDLLH